MSIFGSFKTLPLPDLLPILGRRTGVLEIEDLPHYGRLHMVLERGIVRRLEHNSLSMDRVQARAVLIEMVNNDHGSFRFNPITDYVPSSQDLNWSMEKVLLGLATQVDEHTHAQANLPDPDIVFQSLNLEPPTEEPLWSFWQGSKQFLQQGISAKKLALQLKIPESHVQFFMYKLRLLGRITPVRMIATQAVSPVKTEQQNLASRLLKAIFGRKT
ncbi:MAG: hypothetical protein RLZZ156_1449 [Deinococcota bacterium]|jgi:hypothetical protein